MRINKTKAVPLWLLTLLWLLSLAQLAIAQQMSTSETSTSVPTLYVNPTSYTVTTPDEVFTIDVNIVNVTDLLAFDFKLGYNTTLLETLNATVGPFPIQPFSWSAIEIHESEGYVWVSVISMNAAEGNGTLATITFKATHAEHASCTLDLYDTELYDSNAGLITHNVDNGSVAVIPEFPTTIVAHLLLILTIVAAFLGKMVWSRKRVFQRNHEFK